MIIIGKNKKYDMQILDKNENIKVGIHDFSPSAIRVRIFQNSGKGFPVWSDGYTWISVYKKLVFEPI